MAFSPIVHDRIKQLFRTGMRHQEISRIVEQEHGVRVSQTEIYAIGGSRKVAKLPMDPNTIKETSELEKQKLSSLEPQSIEAKEQAAMVACLDTALVLIEDAPNESKSANAAAALIRSYAELRKINLQREVYDNTGKSTAQTLEDLLAEGEASIVSNSR